MRIQIQMITHERRPVSEFILGEGEDLSQRVRDEIAIGIERGDLSPLGMKETLPPVAAFRVEEGGQVSPQSFALFKADGTEVTQRHFEVEARSELCNEIRYELTIFKPRGDGTFKPRKLGSFGDERTARRIGVLWSMGAID